MIMKKVKCPWIVKGSKTVYQNPWIKVTEDKIIFPNNKPGIYGVVSMPDTVAVAAFENYGIYFVGTYHDSLGLDGFSWSDEKDEKGRS